MRMARIVVARLVPRAQVLADNARQRAVDPTFRAEGRAVNVYATVKSHRREVLTDPGPRELVSWEDGLAKDVSHSP